jgi:hypothetical protein
MRASSCRALSFLAAQSFGLSFVACSSSAAMTQVADAAMDKAAGSDWPVESPTAGDAAFPTDLLPSKEVPGADRTTSQDLIPADGVAVEDIGAAEGPGRKDATPADVLPPADLLPTDASGREDTSPDEVLRDGGADLVIGCLPESFPQCNDDPYSATRMGTCQPDGTCECESYYVLNPTTGRCRYPPRDGSAGDTDALVNLCTGVYSSCQCSCCGVIGRDKMCYYPTLGESVAALAAADEQRWASTTCGAGACSSGIHYVCCTPADPEPSSAATYTASGGVGGYDHLAIGKTGADCASLTFIGPSAATNGLRIETSGSWSAVAASFGRCGDAGAQVQANGALGTLTFRMFEGACVMDLHATLFAIDDGGYLTTARMDGDGIPMPSIFLYCQ